MTSQNISRPDSSRAVITGAQGFIGWHMASYLSTLPGYSVTALDRSAFNDSAVLKDALGSADIVFHFAGVNRADDGEVMSATSEISERLADGLSESAKNPRGSEPRTVIHASSIQAGNGTAYGTAKRAASKTISTACRASGDRFVDLLLPHVFGEHGKPDYNSVIATFCDRIARGVEPEIQKDSLIEPIHAQRLCHQVLEFANRLPDDSGEVSFRVAGRPMRVSAMVEQLRGLALAYQGGVIPDLRDTFDLDLFNTYRSFLFPGRYPVKLQAFSDDRGWLVEAVKTGNGGQVFVSETGPGITRGNHFHRHKVERFTVLKGQARICVRRIGFDHIDSFDISGDDPCFIDMPTLHTHNITNTGTGPLLTMFWANEIFDPENPDTYAQPV